MDRKRKRKRKKHGEERSEEWASRVCKILKRRQNLIKKES